MPVFRAKKENFFKEWSHEMAYVLGFFIADGSMVINSRGSRYLDFQTTDNSLLKKIKKILGSDHKITERDRGKNWSKIYRLQIGSKKMFGDLLEIGVEPRKSKNLKLPDVPKKYFPDFVRGYFDGDGCVSFGTYNKKNRNSSFNLLSTRFTSGDRSFLKDLLTLLRKCANLEGGFVVKKIGGFDLTFSINDSRKLYKFMYEGVSSGLFLERKCNKFRRALNHYWGRRSNS